MGEHQRGQADQVDEERKSERQIDLVHEKKVGEGESLAGAARRVDTDVHRSSLSDTSLWANRPAQSKPCFSVTSPPGRGRASGAGEGGGIQLDPRAITRRSRTRDDLS